MHHLYSYYNEGGKGVVRVSGLETVVGIIEFRAFVHSREVKVIKVIVLVYLRFQLPSG